MRIGPQQVVWIAGASGRMGTALLRQLDHGKYAVVTTDKEVDITDLDAVNNYASINRPDFIVNCAALPEKKITHADKLESYRLNALGARNLAIASEEVGATIVHFSTDDVFSVSNNSHVVVNEFDVPHPHTVYGRSKLAGEMFVRELNPQHLILRSSWVYDERPERLFARVLKAGQTGERIEVPNNQFSSPTSITTFAKATITVMESGQYGLFHAACKGTCSRLEFAKRILENAGMPTNCLHGKYDDNNSYSIELEDMMFELSGLFEMPEWDDDLAAYMTANNLMA